MARMLKKPWMLVLVTFLVLTALQFFDCKIDDAEVYRLNHSAWPTD